MKTQRWEWKIVKSEEIFLGGPVGVQGRSPWWGSGGNAPWSWTFLKKSNYQWWKNSKCDHPATTVHVQKYNWHSQSHNNIKTWSLLTWSSRFSCACHQKCVWTTLLFLSLRTLLVCLHTIRRWQFSSIRFINGISNTHNRRSFQSFYQRRQWSTSPFSSLPAIWSSICF